MKIIFLLFVLIAAVYGGGSQCKLLQKNHHSIIFVLPSDDICSLKPSWENCEGKTTKKGFTFNGATGVCEEITFTGCKPSGNLFQTLDVCESVCLSGGGKLGYIGDNIITDWIVNNIG